VRLPIRARLTAWYVAVLAVAIFALGAFVVVRLRADLTADFDRSLHSAARQIKTGYEQRGPLEFGSLTGAVLRILPADSGSQLITAGGRLAETSGVDLPRAPLLTRAEQRDVLAGHDVKRTAHGPSDSEPFRVYATAVTHGRERDTLLVASSLEGVDSAVHSVLVLMLIAGPALLLVIGGGGWWLARKALLPVARLTEQAERIEVDRLDERVPEPPTADEIGRLAATLNRMLDRLERGVEDKRRLVADASHELRTPLAVMRSELDVALEYDELQPEAARVLDSMRGEVARMTHTVENLLTLARFDEGRLELLRQPFELRELLDDVAAGLGPIAGDKDVTIAVAGDGAVLTADRERIRQVVANLVDNAVKYSRAGGAVTIATWCHDGELGISVADTGAGIPAEALPHVFDRFYRVDSARGSSGGSGLGLAICEQIVTAHGGRIWAESHEGRGSRVSLSLPLTVLS
jgi:heavy metal sensor kinase